MKKSCTTDRWKQLYTARCKVIACEVVIKEMLPFIPTEMSYEILDFGLHLRPEILKQALQTKIDEVSAEADVLILGYGLCSMAVVGLQARSAHLVIPRVDDCISIFLGSCAAYKSQSKKEPGTYYLTKGWIETGETPFTEHIQLVEKYGEVRAKRMTSLMLKNYKRLALINTGHYELEPFRDYTRQTAEEFDLRFEEIEGSSELVKKMLFGPWDDEFVVMEPGQTVHYLDFVKVKSQTQEV
jgi:hypothetical protein